MLQYGYYVIPQFHLAAFRVAYWDKFRRPAISPKYALGFDTWWVDPGAEKSVEAKKGEVLKAVRDCSDVIASEAKQSRMEELRLEWIASSRCRAPRNDTV